MTIKFDGNGRVDGVTNIRPTGEFSFFQLLAPPEGWIVANGSTIGNVGSGATLADATTLALFTAWWGYTDTQLPILTSTGAASTRGASAAADWAALKRLTVFDLTDDRFPVGANGVGTLNGTKYVDQLQGHGHSVNLPNDSAGSSGLKFTISGTANKISNTAQGVTTLEAQALVDIGFGSPRVGTKTLPPRLGMLPCYKL